MYGVRHNGPLDLLRFAGDKVERAEQDVNFDGKPDVFLYDEAGQATAAGGRKQKRRPGRYLDLFQLLGGEIERKGEDTKGCQANR